MKADLIYGLNAIRNILRINPFLLQKIYIFSLNMRIFTLIRQIKKFNIPIQYVTSLNNNKLNYLKSLYYIIGKIHVSKYKHVFKNLFNRNDLKILMLYKIQDPHNLASCIRTAMAFNIDLIILTRRDTVKVTTLINNISHATSLFVPIFLEDNFVKLIKLMKKNNIKIIATSINAVNSFDITKIFGSIAIIMGSEKSGIKASIIKECDYVYKLHTLSACNSINVSVTTGIILNSISK